TAAQALPGALRSQAGFHQDYSFLPDQMTWEVTLPAAVGPAELLTALPGAAQLTDAVELGVTLGSGVRDALLSGTKRTILLGADSALSGERLALLEHVLAETPHYITALRNWRLSRVAQPRHDRVDPLHRTGGVRCQCVPHRLSQPPVSLGRGRSL